MNRIDNGHGERGCCYILSFSYLFLVIITHWTRSGLPQIQAAFPSVSLHEHRRFYISTHGGKICVGGARDEYERDHRHIYGVRRNFQNTETLGLIRPQYKSWCIKRMITCPLGWRALSSPQIYHDFLRAAYTSSPFYCFSPLPLSPPVSATVHLVGKMTEMHPPLSLPSLSIPQKDHL